VANLPTAPRIGPYACLGRRASLSVLLSYYILPAPALDTIRSLFLLHSYQFLRRTMLNSLPSPTHSLSDLAREERSFTFAHFTCEHAWVIGNILRNALRTIDCAALIHISLSSSQTLFHAPSMPGMMPDAEAQVKRKRETVLRWGHSTWFMRCKHGNDKGLAEYYGLDAGAGENGRARYSCEGGGYPVFVKGVEGVVGCIVVVADIDSEQAHGVIVKAIEEYKELRDGFRSPMRSTTVKG